MIVGFPHRIEEEILLQQVTPSETIVDCKKERGRARAGEVGVGGPLVRSLSTHTAAPCAAIAAKTDTL